MWQMLRLRWADITKKLRPVGAMILKNQNKYLLVKKPRTENAWQFPQGGVDAGETFFEGALRELHEECGDTLEVITDKKIKHIFRYFFPKKFNRPDHVYTGAKVVFFVADYKAGTVELDANELETFVWANKKEIQQRVTVEYWKQIQHLL